MQRYLFFIDHVSTWVGKTFSWSILVLTFVVVYDVIMRYVFTAPTTWAYDTEYMLYGTLFIMAGAYAVSLNAHVRGDIIYRRLRPRTQAGIELVLYILFYFPGIVALFYSGYDYFHLSYIQDEHSANSPAGPPIWPFKALIPISAFFLILQGIAEVTRCILALKTGAWPQRLHDVKELEEVIMEEAAAGVSGEKILEEIEGKVHSGGDQK